jgi:hypothetical protein
MDADHEEFEHIPWSSLVAESRDPRVRWLGVAVGVVLAVVLGLVVVRVINGDDGETVVVPGESAAQETAAAPPPVEVSPVSVTTTSQLPSPRLYSEAELLAGSSAAAAVDGGASATDEADVMAMVLQYETSAVAARAEWFVTDFFTIDGDVVGRESVRSVLPTGALAAVVETEAGVSYVEWARAVSVEQIDVAEFEVTVVFRALAGTDRESLHRQPVRAVAVGVTLDDTGAFGVADLPEPVALPPSLAVEGIVAESDEPLPESVRATALAAADAWGADAIVERSSLDSGRWRVEVSVTDASGLRWPLVVRVPVDS